MTAASTETSSPLAPGYKLDRYELLCPIAEGGMASVWVARQGGKHGFEKLVAIKMILPKFAADQRFQQMFLDEARIASRIEHVNVAHILDLGEEDSVLYLAMEYVDGDALSKLNRACARKGVTIPPGVLLRVLADTCAGLHEAHELRDAAGKTLEIVHRDVSPHNILVSTRGVAKLIDFGIAKARSRMGDDTNSGVLKGKVQYMAPEQALSRPVDRRADLWAIGAILYHLLAGRPAFEGENQLATLHLLGSGRPPVPLPDSVHPAIRGVVRRALSHAAERRYATAADLASALEGAMLEAAIPTTTADVAAFVNEHLSERAERRRQMIEAALTAASRRRNEDSFRSSGEQRSASTSSPSFSKLTAAPSRPSMPGLPAPTNDEGLAQPPVSAPAAPIAAARLTPRLSEPPQQGSLSYATLGSAALDASSSPISAPRPRSRKGLLTLVGLVATAAAAAAISFTVFRARPGPAAMPAAAQTSVTPVAPSASPPPAPSAVSPAASAAPAAASGSARSSTSSRIPVVPASALPAVAPPQVRWTPPPAAAAPPPAAPKSKKGSVDDGF